MDFEDLMFNLLQATGIALLIGSSLLVGKIIVADKHVDGYYLSKATSSDGVSCVYAHWTWHTDERAFCSNESQEVIDFAKQANELLKK